MTERRDSCLYRSRHTTGSSYAPWILGGKNEVTEIIVHRRGIQVKRRCTNCNTIIGPIPMQAVWEWIGDLGVPKVRNGYQDAYPACSCKGCPRPGADLHHFAPRNTFGPEADDWPVMPLCDQHHREWHTRMDGYRWHAKAVS